MIICVTGNGKGKTTSALGQAVRAIGDLKRVLMVQFIKGPWRSGEDDAQMLLRPYLRIVKKGLGFVGILGDTLPFGEHSGAAAGALEYARQEMRSGRWDMLILDEVNNAVHLGLIPLSAVLSLVDELPAGMDVILTGRDARQELMDRADIVSEVREVKHPYQDGETGKKGIEW
ncbi:MAG TPA: cob(I)yrinic acid a,c-diamide adenosyltransferase [Candidatus Paceibacterota bacterium]|nr:cob(I)yrinic acid a,c-diamide adenosyltransferase [Candidatus Paceibacterota bacterium]